MYVYNRDRALCHRLDVDDTPRLDRCRPSCGTSRAPTTMPQYAQAREKRHLRQQVRRLKRPRAADAKEITQLKADGEALVGALHQATVENSHLHRQLPNRRAQAIVHVLPTQTTP